MFLNLTLPRLFTLLARTPKPVRPDMVPTSVEALPPAAFAEFVAYKRNDTNVRPAVTQQQIIERYGRATGTELVALFEHSAIPLRTGQWVRRMH